MITLNADNFWVSFQSYYANLVHQSLQVFPLYNYKYNLPVKIPELKLKQHTLNKYSHGKCRDQYNVIVEGVIIRKARKSDNLEIISLKIRNYKLENHKLEN